MKTEVSNFPPDWTCIWTSCKKNKLFKQREVYLAYSVSTSVFRPRNKYLACIRSQTRMIQCFYQRREKYQMSDRCWWPENILINNSKNGPFAFQELETKVFFFICDIFGPFSEFIHSRKKIYKEHIFLSSCIFLVESETVPGSGKCRGWKEEEPQQCSLNLWRRWQLFPLIYKEGLLQWRKLLVGFINDEVCPAHDEWWTLLNCKWQQVNLKCLPYKVIQSCF